MEVKNKSYNNEIHNEIIKRSHERSKNYGVDKNRVVSKKILTRKEVTLQIKNNQELLRIATPFLKILYDLLVDSGFFIVLTDKEGCILSTIGDKAILDAAINMNMIVGAYMDESSIGTNAMGTAIKENMPIQISAKEHFITAYHRWTCSAAPIHNINGEIIGTLNLTGNSDKVHPHTLGLVVAAVRSIENQIKSELAHEEVIQTYQYLNTIMDSVSLGIFAVDKKGIVKNINKIACKMIHMERKNILDKSVESVLSNWHVIFEHIKSGKDFQNEEIVLKSNNLNKRYNLNVYPIKDEKSNVIGMVVSLKDIQNVYNLVNKYTGMRARYTFDDIIGASKEIKMIIEHSKSIANSPSTVLISGESGTGKEILAQAIHNFSSRRDKGFVAINCGAIPQNLIESELFGYADGAFTGAKKGGNPGKFELANGGTLFLDEIGEMPLDMQIKLLRVLQEGCITRVGGDKYIEVNVRIIAATNRDLLKEVQNGKFREDLFFRLSVIPIIMPPLRERKKDIPLFIERFLKIKAVKINKPIPQ
ncbi:MAG: sigma 54-interacting transcriptional regulator, partial [Clostridia bacterium]|nr:sigma 54-interacting transcriptional regulator [Clostridia bacterium]